MIPVIKEKKELKTGTWAEKKPVITDKCTGCGTCERYCPDLAIKMVEKDGKRRAEVNYEYCKGCGICEKVCPFKAIIMKY